MNDIREDLKAFVDGELSSERMEAVRAAVDQDPKLQKEVEFMRMLGLEIKRLAAEPQVLGKEATVSKFRRLPLPWWNPVTLSGRFAYAGALLFVLVGLGAVMFPIFAQPKAASKRTAELSRMKQEQMARDSATGSETLGYMPPPGDAAGGKDGNAEGGAFISKGGHEEAQAPMESESPAAVSPMPEMKGPVSGETLPQRERTSTPPIVSTPSNRMVIKNADITVRVDDAKKAMTAAEALANGLGGYTEGSSMAQMPGQTPRASIILRVPSRSYETAMARLREMGEVPYENSNAQDVTTQYADLEGRLRVLRAEEDSYVTMLRAARKVGELMEIKDRLSSVRQEIASMETQRKALAGESALSTIRVTFEQKVKLEGEEDSKKSGFEETWAKALNGLSAVGEFLGNAAIYLLVFSPIWLPPVLLFWWLGKRAKA